MVLSLSYANSISCSCVGSIIRSITVPLTATWPSFDITRLQLHSIIVIDYISDTITVLLPIHPVTAHLNRLARSYAASSPHVYRTVWFSSFQIHYYNLISKCRAKFTKGCSHSHARSRSTCSCCWWQGCRSDLLNQRQHHNQTVIAPFRSISRYSWFKRYH